MYVRVSMEFTYEKVNLIWGRNMGIIIKTVSKIYAKLSPAFKYSESSEIKDNASWIIACKLNYCMQWIEQGAILIVT